MTTRSRSLVPGVAALALLAAPTASAVDAARLQRLDSYLREQFAQTPLPGMAVVVVEGDRIAFARGYGVEVAGQRRPMTERSSVGIGSLGKSFTALAVLQLVEQGVVRLDDRLVDHLPWFRTADAEASGRITLRMLLSNSSGLPSHDEEWIGDADSSDQALERRVRALQRYQLRREPGTSFEYSNEGWDALALLVQQKSGQPFGQYVDARILQPLGMVRSTAQPERFAALGALHGHWPAVDAFRTAPPIYPTVAIGAGSTLHASAEDLGRYLMALLAGGHLGSSRVAAAESIASLWTPQIALPGISVEEGGSGEPMHYALGWLVDAIDGRSVVHHPGDSGLMSSETFIEPATRTAVALLFVTGTLDRYRWTPKQALANNVLHLVNGRPLSSWGIPRRPDPTANDFELPVALQQRYLGQYVSAGNNRLDLVQRDNGLQAVLQAGRRQARLALDFASPSTVVLRSALGAVVGHFRLTPAGVVSGLEVTGAPGLDGLFRHQLATDPDLYLAQTSADGVVSLVLRRGWSARWSDGQFSATPDAGGAPAGGAGAIRVQGGWGEATFDAVAARVAAAAVDAVRHDETVAGRAWRELVWSEQRAGATVQRQLFYASSGERAVWFVLDAPPEEATSLVRDVASPLLRGLRLDDEVTTSKL